MHRYTRAAFAVVLLALSVSACRKKPVVEPVTQTPAPGPSIPSGGNPSRAGGGGNTSTAADSLATARAIRATEATLAGAIFFDYDVAELSVAARASLDTKAQIMRDNPTVRIKIEGHCDSRGSTEYNLALGQRRAAAALEYLVNRGIAVGRIETVSLGEQRPAMQGETEAAWSKNRRDEFVTIAGSITKPLGD